jgi:preprotein translocase subunit SecG
MLTLAEMPMFVVGLLVALFVIISVMMMLIVLIQRPQGGGLSEAFGSASGSGHTAFGAKTGDALTYATIVIFVAFIGFAVGLNYLVRPPVKASVVPAVTPAAPMGAPTGTVPAPAATDAGGNAATPAPLTTPAEEKPAETAATAPVEPAKPQNP